MNGRTLIANSILDMNPYEFQSISREMEIWLIIIHDKWIKWVLDTLLLLAISIWEVTYGSISSFLSAVLSSSTSNLSISSRLHMDRVDDIKELLHHGHFLVHKVYFSINTLKKKNVGYAIPEYNSGFSTDLKTVYWL